MSVSRVVINNVPLSQVQVVIMPDISHQDLGHVLRYAYTGSLQLPHSQLASFLQTAALLRLTGVSLEDKEAEIKEDSGPQDLSMKPPEKKIKVEPPFETFEASSPGVPSPAHDSKPETFLRKTLLTFPSPGALANGPGLLSPRSGRPAPSSSSQETKHQGPSGSSSKLPNWSQSQLQDAIESVITQRLRFTQASARYGIPKGTLYDNILGKSKRMQVLDQVGLTDTQEVSVLEFCCEISSMPYNRYSSELPCNEC